jgi:hypothetical protein
MFGRGPLEEREPGRHCAQFTLVNLEEAGNRRNEVQGI